MKAYVPNEKNEFVYAEEMKTYKITHKEELIGWFYVEANSEQEALNEYNYEVSEGRIDFSDLEMVDSSDIAELIS